MSISLPAIVPLMGITPASTAELASATVRKIAVIKLILLMLFIILIFFLVLAFRGFSLLSCHFRLFTGYCVKFLDPLRGKFGNFLNNPLSPRLRRDRLNGCHGLGL